MKNINVKFIWDDEDDVWNSTCEEFGVTLASGSFDALVERVKFAVRDILEVDYGYKGEIQLNLEMAQRTVKMRALA